MVGAIEMSFQGFGVGIPLGKVLHPLKLTKDDFDIVLAGLGVEYKAPPILIAGGFKHEATEAYESYLGGLLISIPPYSIEAVGAYRHTFEPDFRSVFLFGRLDGPLLTLEFIEISGVAVSFGYNYSLRTPTGDTLEDFPLLSKEGPPTTSGNPLSLMLGGANDPSSFSSWITAARDSYFFSLGVKADSFQILTIEAALIFGINSGQVKVSVVGRGTAILPPMEPGSKSPYSFVYAELGIVATLDIGGGSLIIEAQLSSNSYILNPFCHLRGGFAACYWFPPSAHAGDWVFTIGGFHPAFKPPPHWPVPPRVGISWELSNVLRVGGEAYFAITPRCIMGGGRLYATFSAGPIYADFEAWASFLVNYKPFFLVAEIGVEITVGCSIHIGIIHIDIHGDISADLHLQGPPFGGYVRVDFKIIHVTIHFGDTNHHNDPLNIDQFIDAVRKPGLTDPSISTTTGTQAVDPGAGDTNSPDMAVIALSAGAATDSVAKYAQTTGQEEWFVRAGQFRFRLESKMAISDAVIDSDILDNSRTPPVEKKDTRHDAVNAIYARVTHSLHPVASTVTVFVERPKKATKTVGEPWRLLPVYKDLPSGTWGQCKSFPSHFYPPASLSVHAPYLTHYSPLSFPVPTTPPNAANTYWYPRYLGT